MREPAASNRFQSNTSAMPALKRPEASHFASSRATGNRAKRSASRSVAAPRRSGRSAKPRRSGRKCKFSIAEDLRHDQPPARIGREHGRAWYGHQGPGVSGAARENTGLRRIKRKILAGLKQHRLRLAKVERLVGEVKLDAPVLPVGNQISQQPGKILRFAPPQFVETTPCAS